MHDAFIDDCKLKQTSSSSYRNRRMDWIYMRGRVGRYGRLGMLCCKWMVKRGQIYIALMADTEAFRLGRSNVA
jgi:hypothetical protein